MKLSRVGIDLAKNVYQLHGVDRTGKTMLKRRLKRHQWFKVLLDKTAPGCEIGMEACASAHHWGRQLQSTKRHAWPGLCSGMKRITILTSPYAETGCQ